jgi:hypothetical protein
MSKSQRMQAYTPTNESTDLRGSSAKRGLGAMSPDYVGPNYLDGGAVASFGDPQLTTRNDYMRQNEGQNLMTNVPGRTVEAARGADLAVTESSQPSFEQLYAREYTSAIMQADSNLKSNATEELGRKMQSPAERQVHLGHIAKSRVQNSMLG